MSSTEVLRLNPGSDSPDSVETMETLRNSHGSAPVIWDQMCQMYLGTEPYGWCNEETTNKLWPLYKDKKIPEHRRALLMMTFDTIYVSKKDYPRAAKDIRKWLEEFPPAEGRVNHWARFAEIYESDPDCAAIGVYHTSVSENPFKGDWDEEADEEGPVDWEDASDLYIELELDEEIEQ